MAKSSQQQAADNRQTVVEAASQLFRAQGFRATSVPEIMQAAGMTHGGFYGHFASKEALAAEAVDAGFDWLDGWVGDFVASHPGDGAAARTAMLETYLSPAHRDVPASGCPVAALAGDVSREPAANTVRKTFTDGVENVVGHLTETGMGPDRSTALADYATLVGALLLARATAGKPISDEILAAAKARLSATP